MATTEERLGRLDENMKTVKADIVEVKEIVKSIHEKLDGLDEHNDKRYYAKSQGKAVAWVVSVIVGAISFVLLLISGIKDLTK